MNNAAAISIECMYIANCTTNVTCIRLFTITEKLHLYISGYFKKLLEHIHDEYIWFSIMLSDVSLTLFYYVQFDTVGGHYGT